VHARSSVFFILTLLIFALACLGDSLSPARAGDGPPVTRSQVILTADKYAGVHWTMREENRTGVTCGGTFLSNYPVGDRIGVGYKWGGWNDMDDFLDKISRGYATGTGGGQTYETIPFDCVVGVSCTGLVSRAWHLAHKYTLNYADPDIPRKLEEITHEIEGVNIAAGRVDGIRKGDVFINEYHVMLFVYETTYGVPMIIDSSREGVRFRPVSWSMLASDGYSAIRYNNTLEDSDPPGTSSNPLDIQPGMHEISIEGNTRDVVSIEFDSYSIDPSFRQPGPEVIYRMRIDGRVMLTASITESKQEGINNDLHLLSSLDRDDARMATDCLAKGDNSLEAVLDAGIWYLIVDSGNNFPGEYTLSLSFGFDPGSVRDPDSLSR
jgi:hypothetical protein